MSEEIGYSGQAAPDHKHSAKAEKEQAKAAREAYRQHPEADLASVQDSAPQGGSEDLAAQQ